jgi:predicted metalloprotease
MSFNDNVGLDTSQIGSGGGGGRRPGMAIGGGVGGLLIVVVGLFFGVDLSGVAVAVTRACRALRKTRAV